MGGDARGAAGDPASWRPAASAADERPRAQAAVERALRDLRALWRSSPVGAAEVTVAWSAALPAALAEVSDPEGTLARHLGRGLADLSARLGGAPARQRAAWLDRLWPVIRADERGWLGELADAWGELAGAELGEAWTARLLPELGAVWSAGGDARWARACLSLLLAGGRHDELLGLLELRPIGLWPERRFGVLALAGKGEIDAAIAYARDSNPLGHPYAQAIAAVCEDVLLAAGRRDQAYADHAHLANERQNCLLTFRALAARYPEREPSTLLSDLIAASPGEEGRWFATARALRFYNLAAEIAQRAPCDPKTLNRAAGERLIHDPRFALDVGLASLRWIAGGHGHAIDGSDVYLALDVVREAAARLGIEAAAGAQILRICDGAGESAEWVRSHVGDEPEGVA